MRLLEECVEFACEVFVVMLVSSLRCGMGWSLDRLSHPPTPSHRLRTVRHFFHFKSSLLNSTRPFRSKEQCMCTLLCVVMRYGGVQAAEL